MGVMEDYSIVLVWNCDHCRASVRMHESLLSFTILFIPAASLKLQVDREGGVGVVLHKEITTNNRFLSITTTNINQS